MYWIDFSFCIHQTTYTNDTKQTNTNTNKHITNIILLKTKKIFMQNTEGNAAE